MARDFNGTTDRIDYTLGGFDGTGACSVALWTYPDALGASVYYFAPDSTGGTFQGVLLWNFWSSSINKLQWKDFRATTDSSKTYHGDITAGSWQHIVATSDGGTASSGKAVYKNGVDLGTADATTEGVGSINVETVGWSIGGRVHDDNRNLNGRIAEVAVWTRQLTAAEAAAVYEYSPLAVPRGLELYAPLIRPTYDIIGNRTVTEDGTSVSAHPRVIYPSAVGWYPSFDSGGAPAATPYTSQLLTGVGA